MDLNNTPDIPPRLSRKRRILKAFLLGLRSLFDVIAALLVVVDLAAVGIAGNHLLHLLHLIAS